MSKDNKISSKLSDTSEFSIISSPNVKSILSSAISREKMKVSQISFIENDEDSDTYM